MCGIAGVIHRGGVADIGGEMTSMLLSLRHRGPDSTGFAIYGQPRDDDYVMRFKVAEQEDLASGFKIHQEIRDRKAAVDDRLAELGVRALPLGAEVYPPRLARLDDPPALLWVLGDPGVLLRRGVAVVGPRAATAYGRRVAREGQAVSHHQGDHLADMLDLAVGQHRVLRLLHRLAVDRVDLPAAGDAPDLREILTG